MNLIVFQLKFIEFERHKDSNDVLTESTENQ